MAAPVLRLCALVLPFIAVASCFDAPSYGCYWTGCQSKWFGLCAAGHFLDSQADDCDGLCTESKSPPCLPLHSHYYCCMPGTPRVTNKCEHCKNKLDFGKEFICCSDCSDPTIMNKDSKLGYCRSGAELRMQLRQQASDLDSGPACSPQYAKPWDLPSLFSGTRDRGANSHALPLD